MLMIYQLRFGLPYLSKSFCFLAKLDSKRIGKMVDGDAETLYHGVTLGILANFSKY